jgi:hypothetical protein
METDYAAFVFAALPQVTFKATLRDNFLQIEARRDDGLLVGGGGVRCALLPERETSSPATGARFAFRTLPGFTFVATLTAAELVLQADDSGEPSSKRSGHWIDLRVINDETRAATPMGGVSVSGPWDWMDESGSSIAPA